MTIGGYIEDDFNVYLDQLKDNDIVFYERLIKSLAPYIENGNLIASQEQLASLKKNIIDVLKSTQFAKLTDNYMLVQNKIFNQNTLFYRKDNLYINTNGKYIENAKLQVINDLRGDGLLENVINPIEKIIKNNIYNQTSFDAITKTLEEVIVNQGVLQHHANTIAQDAMFAFDGAIQKQMKEDYNLKYFFYIGSEIETSRPICSHIKDTFGAKSLSEDDLSKILKEYCPNGIPSEVKITYQTVNGVSKTAKKGNGMKDATTVDSFSIKRGGYKCRHEVKYTRKPIL